jgi:cation diffusion facilitator CzcD-associated flavoprotein CzcO
VFQRSPAWVVPRDAREYPESQQRRFLRFPLLRMLHRWRLYWQNESRLLALLNPIVARALQGRSLQFLKNQVQDPARVKALTPDYTFGCKRVLISNDWYPMFNRPNVDLVTSGIREIRANSIVTDDGVERPVDCIILGTGFVVDPRIYLQQFPIRGRAGRRLTEDWKDGAEAYYGIHVSGYPNLHQLVGPNTALGHNSIIFMIEAQVNYVLDCLRALRRRGADYLDVKADVQARFNSRVQDALRGTVWTTGCASWYQQADGRVFTIWPWATWRYWLKTRHVNAASYDFGRLERRSEPAVTPQRAAA